MTIDSIYYRDGRRLPLSGRVMRHARERMYDLFMREMSPDASTILDLGVSDEENGEANILEKLYPYPRQIACAGLALLCHKRCSGRSGPSASDAKFLDFPNRFPKAPARI
jgi:hypothetical protein